MFLVFLLLFASVSLGICLINRNQTKLYFQGFIYPYAMYLHDPPNSNSRLLLFESIGMGEVFHSLTQKDKSYLKNYEYLGSFMIPSNNHHPPQIVVKNNLFIISWSMVYLKRPHLHKFFMTNNMSRQLQGFAKFFQRREQIIKPYRSYLFDACELWRSWIFVRLHQNDKQFSLTLGKEPGHHSNKKYAFIKQYFTTSQIKNIILQKHPYINSLQLLVISQKIFCVFEIDGSLQLTFKYCSQKQNFINQTIPLSANLILIFYSLQPSTPVFKFQIHNLEENTRVCQIILPLENSSSYFISKKIHNRIVVCHSSGCFSYSFNCQRVYQVEQQVSQLINIFYQRIEHQYIEYVYSKVVIQTLNGTLLFTECDDPSLVMEGSDLCKKANSNKIQQQVSKCKSLGCYQCVRSPNCYFSQGKCEYFPSKEVELFQNSVYANKNSFMEKYARFQSGISSECPSPLKCSINISSIYSYIDVQQDDQSQVQASCQVLLPITSNAQFKLSFDPESKFDLQVCASGYTQIPYTCILQNVTSTKINSDKIMAGNYMLFIFVARLSGPNWKVLSITNLNQQSIHNATLIFSKIVISFVLFTVLVIFYAVFRNKIIMRLAIWGWIQFRPGVRYPLSPMQLEIKIKYYMNKNYLKQISNNTSDEAPKQNHEECCFCLAELCDGKQIFELYCRHQFHKSCLSEWFQMQPLSDKCPVCKRLFLVQEVQLFNSVNHQFHRKQSNCSLPMNLNSEDSITI